MRGDNFTQCGQEQLMYYYQPTSNDPSTIHPPYSLLEGQSNLKPALRISWSVISMPWTCHSRAIDLTKQGPSLKWLISPSTPHFLCEILVVFFRTVKLGCLFHTRFHIRTMGCHQSRDDVVADFFLFLIQVPDRRSVLALSRPDRCMPTSPFHNQVFVR